MTPCLFLSQRPCPMRHSMLLCAAMRNLVNPPPRQVRSYFDFSSTAMLRFAWRVVMEGIPMSADALHSDGWHSLDVPPIPPRGVADVTVPVPWGLLRRALEEGGAVCRDDVFLELKTLLKDATPYAPAVRGAPCRGRFLVIFF